MNLPSWMPPKSAVPVEHLALWNAAMSHMGAPLPFAHNGTSLRLSPIAAPNLQGKTNAVALLTGGVGYIHLDAFPFNALLGVAFDLDQLRDLEGPLADAIYEGAGTTVLEALPPEIAEGLTPQNVLSVEAMETVMREQDIVWFAAAFDGLASEAVFFSIGITPTDLCGFLQNRMIGPKTALTGLKTHIETIVFHHLGQAALPANQVGGLEAGDLIVSERMDQSALALRVDRNVYHFEDTQEGWLCQAVTSIAVNERTNAMVGETHEDQEILSEKAQLELMQIAQTLLTFDLGETAISMADLEQFQAGAIVALPENIQSDRGVEVTVRASGKAIAKGDLIQIDDRIAVRLNHILIPN